MNGGMPYLRHGVGRPGGHGSDTRSYAHRRGRGCRRDMAFTGELRGSSTTCRSSGGPRGTVSAMGLHVPKFFPDVPGPRSPVVPRRARPSDIRWSQGGPDRRAALDPEMPRRRATRSSLDGFFQHNPEPGRPARQLEMACFRPPSIGPWPSSTRPHRWRLNSEDQGRPARSRCPDRDRWSSRMVRSPRNLRPRLPASRLQHDGRRRDVPLRRPRRARPR